MNIFTSMLIFWYCKCIIYTLGGVNIATFFEKNLKHIRNLRNISQGKLANIMKIDRSAISKWENESINITMENAFKIVEILNVDPPKFFGSDLTYIEKEEDIPTNQYNINTIDDDRFPNLKEVYFKTKDGRTVNDMTYEQKQIFNLMMGNIKKTEDEKKYNKENT